MEPTKDLVKSNEPQSDDQSPQQQSQSTQVNSEQDENPDHHSAETPQYGQPYFAPQTNFDIIVVPSYPYPTYYQGSSNQQRYSQSSFVAAQPQQDYYPPPQQQYYGPVQPYQTEPPGYQQGVYPASPQPHPPSANGNSFSNLQ